MRVGTAPGPASTTYTSMLYAAVAEAGVEVDEITTRKLIRNRYDVIHLHWPEYYLYRRPFPTMVVRSTLFLAALSWARRRGGKVVWTAHNLSPHEGTPARYSDWFYRVFTGLVDLVVSPTESGIGLVRRRFPRLSGASTAVIPLGHLRGRYPDSRSRKFSRERLLIAPESTVATFFGNVRPYKNVPALIREFREIADPQAVLLVAGRPRDDVMRAQVEAAANGDDRVRLHLGYISDDAVQDYLRAADIVVLPYTESSNSFVALLALSFDRPILAPGIGAFPELAAMVGTRWVKLYEGDLTASALAEELESSALRHSDDSSPDLDAFSWHAIGGSTVAVYRSVVRRGRRVGEITTPTVAV